MAKAEIKNRIRALRFQHGEMTQQELATRAECTRQTIVMLEQGRYVPSLALAFRIARTFGMTVEDVFEWKE
jgi:putative transcriptional regulator